MLKHTLDLKKLRAFYLVANQGSLRNAAAHLLLSTSAVSIQIKELEKDLGVKLFGRAGRRLVLEPAGQVFLEHVAKIFEAVDEAVDSVSTEKAAKKHIAIALGADLTRYFAPAIGKFVRSHPEVEIALQLKHSRESLAQILEGELDLAIGFFHELPRDLERRTLMKSGFCMSFAASHPVAKIRKPRISDLAQYPVISLRRETDIGQRIIDAFNRAGYEAPTFLEVGNCQSSQDLAAQGIGIAFGHTTCLSSYKSSTMRNIDATEMLGHVDVAVVRSRFRPLSPLHRDLLAALVSKRSRGITHAEPKTAPSVSAVR